MAGTEISSSVPPNDIDLPADDLPDDGAQLNGSDDPAVEARAREMGWKPLADYRGPPGRWLPPADFVARGENILPILRDQSRRQGEELTKIKGEFGGMRHAMTGMQRTIEEQATVIKDLREMSRTATQRGYDQAMADIKAKQRQAVESGDTKAYDQLVEQAEALNSSRPAATPATEATRSTDTPARPQLSGPTQAFIAANPWFNDSGGILSNTMIAFHQEILNERGATQAALNADPALDRELLEEAKARVVEKYPERFGVEAPQPTPRPAARNPRRAAAVAAPTPEPAAPRPGTAGATINSIADPAERAEAREAFNRMKRQLPDFTEKEYMALYDDPHGDILTMQQKPRTQSNGR